MLLSAPAPLDVWDIGHALVGLSVGSLQIRRWFAYPLKIIWELYQLLVYYQPQGYGIKDVWINSILDTLVFAFFYEITLICAKRIARTTWWHRITPRVKGVTAFLLMTFGGAFVMGWDLDGSTAPGLLQVSTVVFPMVFCPAIAALIVRNLITKEGFADVGFTLKLRQNWPFFIAFGIIPAIITAIGSTFIPTYYYFLPEWLHLPIQINLSDNWASTLLSQSILAIQLIIFTIIMVPILFGQEFGWRSYLQPRLFRRNSLLSAFFTGLIWGLWLILVTWRAYRLSGSDMLALLVIPFVTVCLSIILGWLHSRTGSIWVTSMLHGAVIVAGGSLIFAPVYINANMVYISPLGIWSFIPLGCLCVWILIVGFRENRDSKFQKSASLQD